MTCDLPTVFREVKRTAIKAHKCYECNRIIEAKQKYIVVTGLWEGKWLTYKFCLRCRKLYDLARDKYESCPMDEEGPAFGELKDWIREARR